jgi:hypothetical protein
MRTDGRTEMTNLIAVFLTFANLPNKYALWENVFCIVVCATVRALIITKHTQITNKCTIIFMMYFIHNILTDIFGPVSRPKHVGENILGCVFHVTALSTDSKQCSLKGSIVCVLIMFFCSFDLVSYKTRHIPR